MKSPHHQIAFSILTKHPDVLLDDEPLDDLLEAIASALQDAFDLGFKAAGGSIHPIVSNQPGELIGWQPDIDVVTGRRNDS